MRKLLGILLLTLSCPLPAQFEDVSIKTVPVGGAVYMMEGRGGNLGVMTGPDGVLLIDDQYAPLTAKILAAIAEIDDGPIRFVLNTHWHFDHTGGNEELGGMGAVIVSQDNARQRMSTDQFMQVIDRNIPALPPAALPVVTFNDRVTFHFNGEAVVAYHAAHAHTDGDIIIHFPQSNVIHMGDIFFNKTYPLIDLDSGGTAQGMIAAVQSALGLCHSDTRVIPGHGPLANCADLETYGQMLADVTDRVRELMGRGMTLEEVVAARPNAKLDEELGGGFIKPDRFLEFIYRSLSEAAP
ncbi:MAG: MBL fold metallo-hydrolase [Xanthomonadales bacterium]|jgi:glyoxylase-like metal-dependent hydrolase (beta-lactamase superfamily II)|nr:MBL fold metallo-hydrolase [Xanthomonadales bacterium]